MNTFCSGYDWTEKKVYVFATSGGSSIGKTAEKLVPYVPGAEEDKAYFVKNAMEVIKFIAEI